MGKIIEVKNAIVSYRDNVALKGISFSIEEGEMVGIVGPNGAGKTTLLTLINGLGKKISGEVKVLGHFLRRKDLSSFRKEIGYVPQNFSVDPRMPVLVYEAVMMGRYGKLGLFRRPGPRDHLCVREAIRLMELENLQYRPVGNLSGGELQKVALGRALAQEPQMLLLDEPTANLDLKAQDGIIALIEKLHSRKSITILLVTHELNLIPQSCDRIILLKRGEIFGSGKMKEMLQEDILSRLYEFPVRIVTLDGKLMIVPYQEGVINGNT